ncbi:MAG: peptidoglycan-binding protein, partial [Patescibacteria group bacterium]
MKNKNFSAMVLSVAILGAVTLTAGSVYAAGLTQAQINAIVGLLQSFGAEQSVINNVQVSLSGGTPSVPTTSTTTTLPASECYRLSTGMWVGLSDREAGNEVSRLQKFLRAQGDFTYSEITGFYGPATEEAVRRFQSRSGIVSSGNAENTGYGVVGPSTRAKIAAISCGNIYPLPIPTPVPVPIQPFNNLPPVIDGISGPTALNISEMGTWTIKAHDPENGALSYSVHWGDSANTGSAGTNAPTLSTALQTTTFTHSYSRAGTYKVGFTVTDNKGLSVQSTISVQVGDVTQPIISVLTPKASGENWYLGTSYEISWTDRNLPASFLYFIYLKEKSDQILGGTIPNSYVPILFRMPNDKVSGSKYTATLAAGDTKGGTVSPGLYYIEVDATDQNGNVIASGTSAHQVTVLQQTVESSITVLSPNGGETWQTGSTQTIAWNSTGVNKVSIWLCKSGICGRFGTIPAIGITNTGSYSFVVSTSTTPFGAYAPASDLKIRVASEDNYPTSTVYDDSNSYFTIVTPPATPMTDDEI